MPVFPGGNPQTRLSPSSPVEIASTRDARIQGEQMQQFATGLGKIGDALADAQVTSAQYKSEEAAAKARQDAVTQSKDPAGADIPALTEKLTNENLAEVRQSFNDPLVNMRMEGHYQKISSTNSIFALAEETKVKSKFLVQTYSNNSDEGAKRILSNPELAPIELKTFRTNMDNQVRQGVLSQATADGLFGVNADKFAKARVDGLIAQKKFGQVALELGGTEQDLTMEMTPDQLGAYGLKADGTQKLGYKLKNGEVMDPTMTEVYRQLKPEVRQDFLNKVKSERDKALHVNMSTVNAYFKAGVSALMNGEEISPQHEAQVAGARNQVPEELKGIYEAEWQMAKELSPVMKLARNGTMENVNKALAELPDPEKTPDIAQKFKREELRKRAVEGIQGIYQQKNKDINGYNLKINPDLAQSYAAMQDGDPAKTSEYIAKAKALAVASGVTPRITTDQQAQKIGMELSASMSDPYVSANYLQKLEQQYGAELPTVIAEVHEKDKSVDPSIIIAANMYEDGSKFQILENIRNRKTIEKSFSDGFAADQKNNLKEQINVQVDKFQAGISDSGSQMGSIKMSSVFRDQIEIQAQKLMLAGRSSSDAVAQATDTIIGKNFALIPTSSSTVLVPKNYSTAAIQGFFQENDPRRNPLGSANEISPRLISKFNIGVPAKVIKNNPSVPEQELQRRYFGLIKSQGKWVTNANQTGANLIYSDQGVLKPVLNKDGKPVTTDFKDIGNYYSKAGK